MTKAKKKITNPMTIIAIFATLSEASAAVSLPFLDNEERQTYIWFLISFPFYLLFLFFITLNFNYKSLYAPSDFQKSKQFIKVIDDDAARSEKSKHALAPEPHDKSLSAVPGQKLTESRVTKHQVHTPPKGKPDYLLQSLQDPPACLSVLSSLSTQQHMPLPASVDCLHIIDARWLRKKKDISHLLAKINRDRSNQNMMLVFLTCSTSEHLLNEKTLNQLGASIHASQNFACLTYNLSTLAVALIRQNRTLSSNEQPDKRFRKRTDGKEA